MSRSSARSRQPAGTSAKSKALSVGQKTIAGTLAASALLAAVLHILGALPVIWPVAPVIEVHQHSETNPFKTVFVVSNPGDLFAIERAQVLCKLEDLKVGKDTWNVSYATDQLNAIDPNSAITSPCVFPPGQADLFSQAREGGVT